MKSIHLVNSVARVEISPSLGGSILAYNVKINGQFRPILRPSSQVKTVLDTSYFPLVPYSNRIKQGQFNWLGKKITLPLNHLPEKHSIHGHGWQLAWNIVKQTETSLTIEYHYGDTHWPYAYSAQQVFTLEGMALSTSLSVTNTSDDIMPAGLGFHPYFSLTQNTSLRCTVDKMWAIDDESMPTNITEAPASMATPSGLLISGSNLDNVFTGFTGAATIVWPEWQAKARITTSTNCQFMVIYSPPNEDYFCFEPVTHSTDALNKSSQDVMSLKPQEKATVSMCISPEATQA